jgi:hypothetical protein
MTEILTGSFTSPAMPSKQLRRAYSCQHGRLDPIGCPSGVGGLLAVSSSVLVRAGHLQHTLQRHAWHLPPHRSAA